MDSIIAHKIVYNGSLLNDLPAELKYRILDLLDPTTLKKCRLINKTYQECIDTCEKYNKYWILDLNGWVVTKEQEIVDVFSSANIKIEHLMNRDCILSNVPKLFKNLGKTVTTINHLPFDKMDDETIVSIVTHFNKVEELNVHGTALLNKMIKLRLVWPSIKRLNIIITFPRHYKGNFSEFPNADDITLKFISTFNLETAVDIIKTCPQRITGISNVAAFLDIDIYDELCEIPGLKLKFAKLGHKNTETEQKFFNEQTAIEACDITTFYDFDVSLLPDNLNPSTVTIFHMHLLSECTIDVNSLKKMTNLTQFDIKLDDDFYEHEPHTCILDSHDYEVQFLKVTSLHIDSHNVSNACFKCIKVLLKSFPNLTELGLDMCIDFKNDFYIFWKKFNKTLKKTGLNSQLIVFTIKIKSIAEVNLYDYNAFKKLATLPNVKKLILAINWTNVTQNHFKLLHDKCPSVKSFAFGIEQKFDFNLAGFIIHQWQDLKKLRFNDNMASDDDNHITASKGLIAKLMDVPLKLSVLHMPIKCKAKDVFPLLKKFPTLKSVQIFNHETLTEIHPTDYYRHIKRLVGKMFKAMLRKMLKKMLMKQLKKNKTTKRINKKKDFFNYK